MSDQKKQASEKLESAYKVRQVTAYQASWTEQERGESGKFTIQLILDKGVDEYILSVDEDDVDALLSLLKRSKNVTFDLERKVLMFGIQDVA